MRLISLVLLLSLSSAVSFAAEFRPYLNLVMNAYDGKTAYSSDRKSSILSSLSLGWSAPSELILFGKGDPSSMLKYGARLQTRTGKYFTAIVPFSSLASLRAETAIDFLEYGPPMEPLMNLAFPYVSANQSEAAGYRGDDVIIGVVDTGLDVNHRDFLSDNGLSRVLYLWDQTSTAGNGPAGFDYGREWTKYDIDNGLCTEVDEGFHGTHVTGIAAGNGNRSSGFYKGISPRANIIFVKMNFSAMGYLLDAVNYVFFRAKQLNKPCVINLSLGNQYGSHTSKDDFNQAMDELVNYYGQNGHIIVWAAGNDGTNVNRVHAQTNLSASGTIDIPFYCGSPSSMYLYFWYDDTNGLDIKISYPSGTTAIDFTNTSSFSLISTSELDLQAGANTSGEKYIALTIHSGNTGVWNITFSNHAPIQVDGYINNFSGGLRYFPYNQTNGTLSGQASQGLAISVGAIVTKNEYTNFLGTVYQQSGTEYTLHGLAGFSSHGPTRDNKNKPEVAAPGSYVVAPYAYTPGWSLPLNERISEYYAVMQGTSMAAPVVTGIIAQLLEKEPYLTAADIRAQFAVYAKTNSAKPLRDWDPLFGYGIADLSFLNAVNAAQAKLDVSLKNNVMNVSGDKDNTLYVLFRSNSSQIGSTVRAAVYDRNGGLVRELANERISQIIVKEYSWNGKDQFARTVQPGLYFLLVTVDNAVSRYPVLIVR